MNRFLTILFLTNIFSAYGQTAKQNSLNINNKLRPCKINGVKDSVLCGSYPVFENRETLSDRKINLKIIVIPALHPNSSATPIFYIDGGPGVASTNNASFFADSSIPYRQYHDIVLVDIRGTGGSNGLNCSSLQIKNGLQEQFEDMYPVKLVKECYDSLSKRADLKQYTTTNAVKDLEDVRKWLGYGKINIYGLSYGTRVALVYMKMFPHSIQSCILWSPIPTYGRMPLYHALYAQNSLELLFTDCKNNSLCNNSFPDLEKEFNSLMLKMKSNPFTFLWTDSLGHSENLLISWNSFQTKLRTLMYAPFSMRKIPFIIHQAYVGNFKPFISLYHNGADTSNSIAEGFYLCVTCAEDVPFIKSGEIDSLTNNTFMGKYRINQQADGCANWVRGNIPNDFLEPTISDIPTLIMSGGYDPITPTSSAKEIASHLKNCTLVIIPQMSHTFDGLSNPECFDEICLSFINNPVNTKWKLNCIKTMQPDNYRIK
ncbi:MAG: alpha/beta fold hydrolase [Ferruginibacter sp.]